MSPCTEVSVRDKADSYTLQRLYNDIRWLILSGMNKYFIVAFVAVLALSFGQTYVAHAEKAEGSQMESEHDGMGSSTKDGHHHMGTTTKMHDGEDDENGTSTERERHDNGLHLGMFNFSNKSTEELQSFIDLLRKLIALLLEQRGIHMGDAGEHAASTTTAQ